MKTLDPVDLGALNDLLRAQMAAVHQQFIHVLSLRVLGRNDLAERIDRVDSEDFRNAMQIIDLLGARRQPIMLESWRITPGSDIASILRSELGFERHFLDVLSAIRVEDMEAAARIERASAARRDYVQWLEQQVGPGEDEGTFYRAADSTSELVTHLIALIEQAMLHAFLHWHRGDSIRADDAWRISGAAMLYTTALVRLGAGRHAVPSPISVAPVKPVDDPDQAVDSDRSLVHRCAASACLAARDEDDGSTRRLCLRIADECELIAPTETGAAFPIRLGRSPVFESFDASRAKSIG